MSVQAIAWVLEHAPDLPPSLVAPLLGLANHAHHDGTGAYPTQATLAWYCRKDERQIRRDLAKLLELKLIERGDQRMVSHIDKDERPVVYNLCMWRSRGLRPKPGKPGRPPKEAQQPVDNPDGNGGTSTPPLFTDTDMGGQTGLEKPGGPDVPPDVEGKTGGHAGQKPGGPDVRLTVLDQPSINRPPSSAVDNAAAPPGAGAWGEDLEDEDENQWTRLAVDVLRDVTAGIAPHRLPSAAQFNHLTDLAAAVLRAGWKPGTLTARLAQRELASAQDVYEVLCHRIQALPPVPPQPRTYRAPAAPPPAWRPWCGAGDCDSTTRQLTDDEGRPRYDGGGLVMCPRCSHAAAVLP